MILSLPAVGSCATLNIQECRKKVLQALVGLSSVLGGLTGYLIANESDHGCGQGYQLLRGEVETYQWCFECETRGFLPFWLAFLSGFCRRQSIPGTFGCLLQIRNLRKK